MLRIHHHKYEPHLKNIYSFVFWEQNLNDMIRAKRKIKLGIENKRTAGEIFFSYETKDRTENTYGFASPTKEFLQQIEQRLINDRWGNVHIQFIEWPDNKVVMLVEDGIYISRVWCNIFTKDDVEKFLRLK